MTLTRQQFNRLQYLLGKHKYESLSPQELDELRGLIAIEQPSAATISTEDLVKIGLAIVGVYILAKLAKEYL